MTQGEEHDTGLRPAELDPERPRLVDTPWGSFALFLVAGEVRALQGFCPHMDGPLFEGTLHEGRLTCPWHGWTFDLASGERTDGPPEGERARLRGCAVRVGPDGTLILSRPDALSA